MNILRKSQGRERHCCDGLCMQKPGPGTCPAFAPGVIEAHRRPVLALRLARSLGRLLRITRSR